MYHQRLEMINRVNGFSSWSVYGTIHYRPICLLACRNLALCQGRPLHINGEAACFIEKVGDKIHAAPSRPPRPLPLELFRNGSKLNESLWEMLCVISADLPDILCRHLQWTSPLPLHPQRLCPIGTCQKRQKTSENGCKMSCLKCQNIASFFMGASTTALQEHFTWN